jgi:hypothetical protein
MPFKATTPEERERARAAGARGRSLVRTDPSAAGKRSWQLCTPEQKVHRTRAIRNRTPAQIADWTRRGGVIRTALFGNHGEDYARLLAGILRARAKRLDQPEPILTRWVEIPFEPRPMPEHPSRYLRIKAARAAAQAEAGPASEAEARSDE